MGLFKRFVNIIRSNIPHPDDLNIPENIIEEEPKEINFNDYDLEDANDIPNDNSADKKYYDVLELPYGSDFQEIKKAYRKLLKKYHPDLFQGNTEKQKKAQKVTEEINEAYTYFERKLL